MFLAYTSFAVRLRQGRDAGHGPAAALGASSMQALCTRFGTAGGQIDCTQLPMGDMAALAGVRGAFDGDSLGIELSIPARYLESPEAYGQAVQTARALGVSRARVALLPGRRYETFASRDDWRAFADHWEATLVRMRPAFDRHGLQIGIENHKDWLADELVALLRAIDSPYVGACVDFGNNLALLEDPDETIALLAPYAVTTHLKDMAVRTTPDGFELSEVPLGTGLLPLEHYIATIRRARPMVHFCLEMLTRDPLSVPYRRDEYWRTFETMARDPARVRRFETRVLSHARDAPLPRISGLAPHVQLAAEDDNVRTSVAWARDVLPREVPAA